MTCLGVVSCHILVPNDKPTKTSQTKFNSIFMVKGCDASSSLGSFSSDFSSKYFKSFSCLKHNVKVYVKYQRSLFHLEHTVVRII